MGIEKKHGVESQEHLSTDIQIQLLEASIERNHKISLHQLESLLEFKKGKSIDEFQAWLKAELHNLNISFQERWDEYATLSNKLLEISKLKEQTLTSIEQLKWQLLEMDFSTLSSPDYYGNYSQKTLQKIQSPQNIQDQMYILWVGIMESSFALYHVSKDLTKGIFSAPIDLYRIASGKATYDTWKEI